MPAYRIYWLDQDAIASPRDCLIADADDDVCEEAGSHLRMASAIEVRHGARRVVRVPANKPAA